MPVAPETSAEAVLTAVRIHADRVHDAVRRLGCGPGAAAAVTGASALDLVDAVADDPAAVGDPVGWWFARARALGRSRAGSPDDALPVGGGVLSGDANQVRLAQALEALPEQQRAALLLRDSYALPAAAVGTALSLEPSAALELVARARLAFLPQLLGGDSLDRPGGHSDLEALARLGEGGPVAARDATTRRHVQSCETCSAVLDVQERAHRLLSGLTVVALPDADREELIEAVAGRVRQLLPAALPVAVEEPVDDRPRRVLPLALAALLLLVAVGLGAAVGLYASRSGRAPAIDTVGGPATLVTAAPVLTVPPASRLPALPTTPPTAQVFTLTPSPVPTTPPPSPTASPSVSPTPSAVPVTVALSPATGPDGTAVTVTGTGWTPGSTVQVSYRDPAGAVTPATATGVVTAAGTFRTVLAAADPTGAKGPHRVTVTDGTKVGAATFTVT